MLTMFTLFAAGMGALNVVSEGVVPKTGLCI